MQHRAIDPTKLMRIGMMTVKLLGETGHGPLDAEAARHARAMHERSLREVQAALTDDLREEFDRLIVPFGTEETSQSELRLAQAQLLGWLQGVVHAVEGKGDRQDADDAQAPASAEPDRGMPGTYL